MFNTKISIAIGTLIFITVATGLIILGIQQRQTARPDAQQIDDGLSCPIGSIPPDDFGRCPSGFIAVPVTSGERQDTDVTGTFSTDTFGTDIIGDDGSPTGIVNLSPTPTMPIVGFCCRPITTPSSTPVPFTPVPSLTDTPGIPTPTSCPGTEQIRVESSDGCSATDRCDFSVDSLDGTTIATRSLWSDGTFDYGTQQTDANRLAEQIHTFASPGTYDISLSCGDAICTKQIVVSDSLPGICTTPTPTVPTPSLSITHTPTPTNTIPTPSITITPTPGACRIPVPQLLFKCPECAQQQ